MRKIFLATPIMGFALALMSILIFTIVLTNYNFSLSWWTFTNELGWIPSAIIMTISYTSIIISVVAIQGEKK